MTCGGSTRMDTNERSRWGLIDDLGNMNGLTTKLLLAPSRIVWPSLSDRATSAAPMFAPAPGRDSITKTAPVLFWITSASIRASGSAVPPTAKGMTILIGLLGKLSAAANDTPEIEFAARK